MPTGPYKDFMPPDSTPASDHAPRKAGMRSFRFSKLHPALRVVIWVAGIGLAGLLSILITVSIALAVAYPNLPDVSDLSEYRPKLPLRVFSAEGELLGEFGEERRNFTPIKDIPAVLTNAVLAIEDARFFQHGGVDYVGVIRAGLANVGKARSQGASTITMQVARNVYLSSEKTFTRKIYEILLTFKLEHLLTKNQILEIYMNQIYLGNRAYGFAAAAERYFASHALTAPFLRISVGTDAENEALIQQAMDRFAAVTGRAFLIQAGRLAAYLQAGLLEPQEDEALTVRATRDALTKLEANPEQVAA